MFNNHKLDILIWSSIALSIYSFTAPRDKICTNPVIIATKHVIDRDFIKKQDKMKEDFIDKIESHIFKEYDGIYTTGNENILNVRRKLYFKSDSKKIRWMSIDRSYHDIVITSSNLDNPHVISNYNLNVVDYMVLSYILKEKNRVRIEK